MLKESSLEDQSEWDRNNNADSTLQSEIAEKQHLGTNSDEHNVAHLLQVCSRSKPSSIVLVACAVFRALILRSVVHHVECSWDGVEVCIKLVNAFHA
jgi:hypothetical protein